MRKGSKILIFVILLSCLAYFLIYLISRSSNCKPNCNNKICGQTDGCSGICNGKICSNKEQEQFVEKYKSNIKGICYFDIDDTLTTAKRDDKDKILQECLDNNFAIGIITASSRNVDDICDGEKAKVGVGWMSDLLCKQFNKNPKMYNSSTVLAGKTIYPSYYPSNYPINSSYGIRKGYQMEYGKKMFYPNMSDKCVVLFDDQQNVLDDVKKYNSNLETQCAGYNPNNPYTCKSLLGVLDHNVVKNKVMSMIENGCK